MAQIDPLHSAFYFPAANNVGGGKNTKSEKTSAKKNKFSSLIEQKAAETELVSAGLPVEIAGMEFEEAFIFLRDQADIAADKIKSDLSLESFTQYRKAISNMMKFIVHSNYDVEEKRRRRASFRFKTEKFYLVKVIDEKLDKLAEEILATHIDSIRLLARIDEINGILVDLIT